MRPITYVIECIYIYVILHSSQRQQCFCKLILMIVFLLICAWCNIREKSAILLVRFLVSSHLFVFLHLHPSFDLPPQRYFNNFPQPKVLTPDVLLPCAASVEMEDGELMYLELQVGVGGTSTLDPKLLKISHTLDELGRVAILEHHPTRHKSWEIGTICSSLFCTHSVFHTQKVVLYKVPVRYKAPLVS